ncbi:hypothetical protein J2Z53_002163 [Clostridium moniliforme]|uniref:Uncharacterized protein n=1 Tax=Clostridium moniliforme TaxID=39489 RepID=A0ABS4F2S3_9CLOT|nr:hypothetical protein [Clostridium moniliforme]
MTYYIWIFDTFRLYFPCMINLYLYFFCFLIITIFILY